MALTPRIRESLVIPAICAPMMLVSGPALVLEACKAGIMAGLPRHNARGAEEFEAWLKQIREGLKRHEEAHPGARTGPLAVNITANRGTAEAQADLEICAKYGVDVFISALGNPAELAKMVHGQGGLIYHDVTSLRFAAKAAQAGVDGLTCIGSGGGGHSGTLNSLAFIPKVRAFWDGTIIFAGCVSNGAAIRAAEILGADLAYLGTRFIATAESLAPAAYKEFLVQGSSTGLTYSDRISGVPANWINASLERVGLNPENLPDPQGKRRGEHLPPEIRPWRNVWSAGQGIDLIDDVPNVAQLVRRLREEYVAACAVPDMCEVARLVDAAGT